MSSTADYRALGEAAWRWVLDQVQYDDLGPWIPASVTDPPATEAPWDRDGRHSGIGGLAHVLAEVRHSRAWSPEEGGLASAIAARLRARAAETSDVTWFDGLAGDVVALALLDEDGLEAAVARMTALAEPDGWPQTAVVSPRYAEGFRLSDATLGTAGVLLAGLEALRLSVPGAAELSTYAADVLMTEAEPSDHGLNWLFVPRRFVVKDLVEMPNLSHGLAGIALALADAGVALHRPDLVDAARRGAEHLVTLADTTEDGFVVPRQLPPQEGMDLVTFTWCHGPTGTAGLFVALERAGVESVAGAPPAEWFDRCLRSLRASGIPERRYPGFWDNDGRCCGTAGVGEVFLSAYERRSRQEDLDFAGVLSDALVDRALVDGDRASWRFLEHRNPEPLLPPGVGWMQGTAGIAAYLLRAARVNDHVSRIASRPPP